jgi:hypothetical protein
MHNVPEAQGKPRWIVGRTRTALVVNPASAVYGTVLVAGELAIEAGTGNTVGEIFLALFGSVVAFWLAHGYTTALGIAIGGESLTLETLRRGLVFEWPVLESAVIPAVALLFASWSGAAASTAAVVALVVATTELVGWVALASRRAGLVGGKMLVSCIVAAAFGLALIGLKYVVH